MIRRSVSLMTIIATALTAGVVYSAQAAPTSPSATVGVQSDSVTGCLQKGKSKDTYVLTDKQGKEHWVTSKTVSLAGHVGHTVTLSGSGGDTMMADNGQTMADSGKMAMSDSGKMKPGMKTAMSPTMTVTALTMVSPSCS